MVEGSETGVLEARAAHTCSANISRRNLRVRSVIRIIVPETLVRVVVDVDT